MQTVRWETDVEMLSGTKIYTMSLKAKENGYFSGEIYITQIGSGVIETMNQWVIIDKVERSIQKPHNGDIYS